MLVIATTSSVGGCPLNFLLFFFSIDRFSLDSGVCGIIGGPTIGDGRDFGGYGCNVGGILSDVSSVPSNVRLNGGNFLLDGLLLRFGGGTGKSGFSLCQSLLKIADLRLVGSQFLLLLIELLGQGRFFLLVLSLLFVIFSFLLFSLLLLFLFVVFLLNNIGGFNSLRDVGDCFLFSSLSIGLCGLNNGLDLLLLHNGLIDLVLDVCLLVSVSLDGGLGCRDLG